MPNNPKPGRDDARIELIRRLRTAGSDVERLRVHLASFQRQVVEFEKALAQLQRARKGPSR